MFRTAGPLWEIAARSAIVYVALFVAMRLAGKREIGQMTVFDLVLILLIANAVQNAMVGSDVSVQGGIVAALTLLAVNVIVAFVRLRSPFMERLFEGHPVVLVQRGRFVAPHLRRTGVDEDDILMAMREHGLDELKDVELAVLETDGSISIIPTSSPPLRSPRRRARAIRKHG